MDVVCELIVCLKFELDGYRICGFVNVFGEVVWISDLSFVPDEAIYTLEED